MTAYNPKLDLVNINAHTKFGQFLSILKILRRNKILMEILTSVKDRYYVTNVRKMMCYNPNLDLVNAYTKFGQILSMCSQNVEWK